MEQMTFIAACRQFFGFKPGQTLSEFGAEIKQLTHADKVEIAEGIRQSTGWDVTEPLAPTRA